MFKPFYVHEHHQPGKLSGRTPRGFTLKVSPDPKNPRCVIVQGAWCSNKDEFNKKTGRSLADIAMKVPSITSSSLLCNGINNVKSRDS